MILHTLHKLQMRRDGILFSGRDFLPLKKMNEEESERRVLNIPELQKIADLLSLSLRELYQYYKKKETYYHWVWWVDNKEMYKALDTLHWTIKDMEREQFKDYYTGRVEIIFSSDKKHEMDIQKAEREFVYKWTTS